MRLLISLLISLLLGVSVHGASGSDTPPTKITSSNSTVTVVFDQSGHTYDLSVTTGGATNGIQQLNGFGTNTTLNGATVHNGAHVDTNFVGRLIVTNLPVISAMDYGATGNGTDDDSVGLKAAITAAGSNGTLVFPAGKTFLHTSRLVPLSGQLWSGYGSTLKRANEVLTTTATAIGTGSSPTTFTVASTNGWAVGMGLTIFSGSSFDAGYHEITAMGATTLTVNTAFTTAFPGGGNVVSAFDQIAAPSNTPGLVIQGLTIDGNRANNTSLQRWEITDEIFIYSDHGVIKDCYIHDAQADAVIAAGENIRIVGNYIDNCQGNGIHIGTTLHAVISGNFVRHCNLSATTGHYPNGCITYSNFNMDATFSDNYCEDGFNGIGGLTDPEDSQATFTGNIITNARTYATHITTASHDSAGKATFQGNHFYASGPVYFSNIDSPPTVGEGPYATIFNGNYLENTVLQMIGCNGMTIANNIVTNSDTNAVLVLMKDVRRVSLNGNTFRNGATGVFLDASTATNNDTIAIEGNTFINQSFYGINCAAAASGSVGVSISNNKIRGEAGVIPSGYVGMQLRDSMFVHGNDIILGGGQSAIQCSTGSATGVGSIVTFNRVVVPAAGVSSILIPANATNNWVMWNALSKAPFDSSPGTSQNWINYDIINGVGFGEMPPTTFNGAITADSITLTNGIVDAGTTFRISHAGTYAFQVYDSSHATSMQLSIFNNAGDVNAISTGHLLLSPGAGTSFAEFFTTGGIELGSSGNDPGSGNVLIRNALQFENIPAAYITSSGGHPVIYSTRDTGTYGPFLDQGNLIIQARPGVNRDTFFLNEGTTNISFTVTRAGGAYVGHYLPGVTTDPGQGAIHATAGISGASFSQGSTPILTAGQHLTNIADMASGSGLAMTLSNTNISVIGELSADIVDATNGIKSAGTSYIGFGSGAINLTGRLAVTHITNVADLASTTAIGVVLSGTNVSAIGSLDAPIVTATNQLHLPYVTASKVLIANAQNDATNAVLTTGTIPVASTSGISDGPMQVGAVTNVAFNGGITADNVHATNGVTSGNFVFKQVSLTQGVSPLVDSTNQTLDFAQGMYQIWTLTNDVCLNAFSGSPSAATIKFRANGGNRNVLISTNWMPLNVQGGTANGSYYQFILTNGTQFSVLSAWASGANATNVAAVWAAF